MPVNWLKGRCHFCAIKGVSLVKLSLKIHHSRMGLLRGTSSLDVACSFYFQAYLPTKFSEKPFNCCLAPYNPHPPPTLDSQSPFKLLFGEVLSFFQLLFFGFLCHAYDLPKPHNKFTPIAKECVFGDILQVKNGCRVYFSILVNSIYSRCCFP